MTTEAGAPRGGASLAGRLLSVPLLGKLAGANLLVVLAAFVAVGIEQRLQTSGSAMILGIALALSLTINLALVYIALRPLSDLEAVAARVSAGDMEARVPPSLLADRDMSRIGTATNTLLDHVGEERERVRRLAVQVIRAQDEERARVARELHDSTAQILAAIMLQLGVAARESTSEVLNERIATLRELASEALEEVRTMAHTMHPRILDDLGLGAALEWLARQTGAQESVSVCVTADASASMVPPHLASVLYRVAQEALRNVVRHAGASHADVSLQMHGGSATLEVTDDGRGFDVRRAEERRPGMGLFSMRERVELVNGQLDVTSLPGRGTRVVASVPLTN